MIVPPYASSRRFLTYHPLQLLVIQRMIYRVRLFRCRVITCYRRSSCQFINPTYLFLRKCTIYWLIGPVMNTTTYLSNHSLRFIKMGDIYLFIHIHQKICLKGPICHAFRIRHRREVIYEVLVIVVLTCGSEQFELPLWKQWLFWDRSFMLMACEMLVHVRWRENLVIFIILYAMCNRSIL